MTPPPNAQFGQTSWTSRYSTRSSSASVRRSACSSSQRRCRRARASPSRCCRWCSPRCTKSSTAGSIVVLPEDADARDAAEAAAWFAGDDRVALFPSRGVHWGSGLEPPPHLVGERARALEVLERGGLVCASAAAIAEGLPPRDARPAPLAVRVGDEPMASTPSPSTSRPRATSGSSASRSVDSSPSAAGSSTSSRRPGVNRFASSSSATRSSRSARSRRSRSARCARSTARRSIRQANVCASWSRSTSALTRARSSRPTCRTTWCRHSTVPPDIVWSPDEVQAAWEEQGLDPVAIDGATTMTQLPQGQPFSFDAQRPALAARGLSEAENELSGLLRQELDVVVVVPAPR